MNSITLFGEAHGFDMGDIDTFERFTAAEVRVFETLAASSDESDPGSSFRAYAAALNEFFAAVFGGGFTARSNFRELFEAFLLVRTEAKKQLEDIQRLFSEIAKGMATE